jgi:hypothetical protein
MPYRKHNVKEANILEAVIVNVEKQITERQNYLARLKQEQQDGIWECDPEVFKKDK